MKRLFRMIGVILTASAVIAAESAYRMLPGDQKLAFAEIASDAVFSADAAAGCDFQVGFGEKPAENMFWQVVEYDYAKCRVRIDHYREGSGPFGVDYAGIVIQPLVHGICRTVFQCGPKRVTILVNGR